MTGTLAILIAALLIDRIVGDPPRLWNRIPHPVVVFGRAIAGFDRSFNRKRMSAETRRFNGTVAIVVLLAAAALAGYVLHGLLVDLVAVERLPFLRARSSHGLHRQAGTSSRRSRDRWRTRMRRE